MQRSSKLLVDIFKILFFFSLKITFKEQKQIDPEMKGEKLQQNPGK